MAFVSTATYFIKIRDFEKAKAYLREAVAASPKNFCNIEASSDFEALRAHDRDAYTKWLNELRAEFPPPC